MRSQKLQPSNSLENVVKFTTKLQKFLIFLLPACLFLASYPQISLGGNDSMNLELSIPEIWLVFFSVASLFKLPQIWRKYRKLFLRTAIFPLYAVLSVCWSANHLRGLLTAGLLILLWYSVWNVVLVLLDAEKIYRDKLQTVFLSTTVIFAVVCWLQCILDVFGAGRETSLLCLGCTSESFGFPHPNGLTLEPQFMGNLLIAPTFYTFNLYLKRHQKKYLALFAFLTSTLFLTFSRGAIYAFGVAFVARLVVEYTQTRQVQRSTGSRTAGKSKFGYSLLTIPVIILSFAFTLTMQGVFAELGPTSTDFVSATTGAVHQLSLGKIDLRPERNATPENEPQDTDTSAIDVSSAEQLPAQATTHSLPVFDGYVAESTNVRVDLTNKALDVWDDSPKNSVFGTGLGSAGTALYQKFPDEMGTSKEIVQNEYASLLLELGLLGYTCLFISIVPFIKISAIELSYLITLCFFSGLPNAFHVYLFPPLVRTPETEDAKNTN